MKRFTDTDKWKDEWVLSLKPIEKLVYVFILDNCDNAGFFDINVTYNSFMLGIEQSEYSKAVESLDRCYVISKDKKKIWIKKFVFHQKNTPLNKNNNAHKQIITLIKINQNNFDYDFLTCPYLGADQGLFSPTGKGKGKGNSKKEDIKNSDKKKYLDVVYLTDNEYSKIVVKYKTEDIANKAIEKLNNYKASSGKKYKSDYHALIGWVYDDLNKKEKEENEFVENYFKDGLV